MKKLFYLLLALPLVFASCDKNSEDDKKPADKQAVLTLTSAETMEFDAEGGVGEITYTLEMRELSRTEDPRSVEVKCEAEWVTNIAVAEDIQFTVEANDGEARQTAITVSYLEESFSVAVKQSAYVAAPELGEMHTIAVEEISWRDALVTITPENEDREYVAGIFTRSMYDAKFGEDKDAIIGHQLNYWKDTAAQYEEYGYDDPWQFYMQMEQRSGEQYISASELLNLTWGTDYVVYCFGIADDGTVTSAVTTAEFSTVAPEPSDNKFEIVIDNTTASSITFTVKTTNDDPYFVSLQQTGYTDSYGPDTDQPYEEMINDLVGTYPDHTLNQKFIRQGTAQFESEQFLSSVNAMREYKVIVCGFENGPTTEVLLSEAIKPGTTASEEPLELYVEVGEVKHNSIAFSVSPSVASRTYYAGIYTADAVGADADAFAATITPDALYNGYQDFVAEELEAETEYVVLAFGYNEERGEISSDIVISEVITTLEEPEEPVFDGPFAIAVEDITWHDATVSITPEDSSATYIAGIISKADYTNKCGSTPAGIVEMKKQEWQELAAMYKEWGYNDPWQYYMREELKSGARSFVGSQLLTMRWSSDYVAYCFGMDNKGELTADAAIKEFSTLSPEASSNSFAVSVDAATSGKATFTVTAANDDPYYVSVQQESYFAGYGPNASESYEDMVYNLVSDYSDSMLAKSIYNGTTTHNKTGLRSDRSYCVVVVGFENGPTTEVYISEPFSLEE